MTIFGRAARALVAIKEREIGELRELLAQARQEHQAAIVEASQCRDELMDLKARHLVANPQLHNMKLVAINYDPYLLYGRDYPGIEYVFAEMH